MSIIIHGFVEHLEWEGSDTPTDVSMDPSKSSVATVARWFPNTDGQEMKDVELDLSVYPPNIAHLLLGYKTRHGKQVSESSLQDAGVLGSPRSVLHAILSLVQHTQEPSNPIGCHYSSPKLAELCYKVIFQLCSHRDLSTPTLRYLRNSHDFFHSQLSAFRWTLLD